MYALRCVHTGHANTTELNPGAAAAQTETDGKHEATRKFEELVASVLDPMQLHSVVSPAGSSQPPSTASGPAMKMHVHVQTLRFSLCALKCLARAGMTTVTNAHHPSAREWHTARQELQRQEDQQQSQIQVADGCDERGNSRLHKLKGQLSVDTALTAQGGSRAPNQMWGTRPQEKFRSRQQMCAICSANSGIFCPKSTTNLKKRPRKTCQLNSEKRRSKQRQRQKR